MKQAVDRVSRREWSAVVGFAVALVVMLQVPYMLGYVLAQPGTAYTGLLINVEDGSYLSAIGEGLGGAWLYHTPFTTEPHAAAFLEVFYLALGHIARVFNLSATAMWHGARAGTAAILWLALFGFISLFLKNAFQRWTAFLFAVLGAGFDWAWFPWEQADALSAAPLDWRMPEAHLFFGAMTYPHYAMNIVLILAVFVALGYALSDAIPEQRRWLLAVGAGIGNLVMGLVYPFLIFLTAGVAGASYLYLTWRARKILWRHAGVLFIAFAIPLPLFLYYQFVLMTNPVLQTWNAQAITLSPNPLHYILAYAPYLLLGALTLKQIRSSTHSPLAFLWIWVGVVAVLLYAPLNPQRRFVLGLNVPLAILATVGLCDVALPWLARTRAFVALSRRPNYSVAGLQKIIVISLIALTSLANVYVWISSAALLGFVQPYPLFRPVAELNAMDWLHANTARDAVILSAYWTGSFIPARAGNPVFVGQRYETIRFDDKRLATEKFFNAATDDAWRATFVREQGIAYVFWGRGERDLGAFDPAQASYLAQVFANDAVRIYRVVTP